MPAPLLPSADIPVVPGRAGRHHLRANRRSPNPRRTAGQPRMWVNRQVPSIPRHIRSCQIGPSPAMAARRCPTSEELSPEATRLSLQTAVQERYSCGFLAPAPPSRRPCGHDIPWGWGNRAAESPSHRQAPGGHLPPETWKMTPWNHLPLQPRGGDVWGGRTGIRCGVGLR